MAGKQTKVFSEIQLQEAVIYVERHSNHPLRNCAIKNFEIFHSDEFVEGRGMVCLGLNLR
jgi:hypothetical protein